MTTKKKLLITFSIIVFVAVFSRFGKSNKDAVIISDRIPKVTEVSLDQYQGTTVPLKTIGTVEASTRVELRSQANGAVRSVDVAIGDEVSIGQTIARIDQAGLLAQLAQAQAGLSLQNARHDELVSGTRQEELDVVESQITSAQSSVADAELSVQNTITKNATDLGNLYGDVSIILIDAHAKASDAVQNQLVDIFLDGTTSSPSLSFTTSDSQAKSDVIAGRIRVNSSIDALKNLSEKSTADFTQLERAMSDAEIELKTVRDFIERTIDVIDAAQTLPTSTHSIYKANASGARASVSGAITTIVNQRQMIASQNTNGDNALASAEARLSDMTNAVVTLESQLTLRNSGATTDQLKQQQALINQAHAAVRSILTQLDKTTITSPISGSIVVIPLHVGELVNPGNLIATIVDTNGLEIRTYIGSADAGSLATGGHVQIEGGLEGVITRIAAGVDPSTQKVEVVINLTSKNVDLVVGELLNIELALPQPADKQGAHMLPLTTVKTGAFGATVLTVDENGVLVAHSITTGNVLDDRIEVLTGLEDLSMVVESVRGLTEGKTVEVR